jgi:divalent metal cation (Fe/Co/Zn/Cd) transporter
MKTDLQPSGEGKPAPISSFAVLGARLTWTAIGPLALVATLWGVASTHKGWLTPLDAVFALVVGLMILARWVEQRSGTATTMTGEPATAAQCKRYTVLLVVIAGVAWIAAKTVGGYLLH